MSTASVTIRIDESTKQAAGTIAEDFGFDISPITHAFRKQVEREQVIPLGPECPNPTTSRWSPSARQRGSSRRSARAMSRRKRCSMPWGATVAEGGIRPAVPVGRRAAGDEARRPRGPSGPPSPAPWSRRGRGPLAGPPLVAGTSATKANQNQADPSKWSVLHVRQTVVLNRPNRARKSARDGPSSTHGPCGRGD